MSSAIGAAERLNVVVGITGGIAAYKAVGVIRELVLEGHDVHVVATENALRFIGRPTLEAISRNIVHSDLYDGVSEVRHVTIGQAADLVIIAPATANTIAKLAVGLADDLLGNTVLASVAPLVVAPAMHTEMWQNPATVANIEVLRERGITIVGPGSGQLTGEDSGPGRMSEPAHIVEVALATVRSMTPPDLAGQRILITAGGTREPIDPVRFIGNRSSGRQGVALAAAALERGARVTLVAANLEVDVPAGIDVTRVGSAEELASAVGERAGGSDVIIMTAAVADYRPRTVAGGKIKKQELGEVLRLELVENPDILATIVRARTERQVIIGFAAETEPDDAARLQLAREKIARKGCDYLVLNRVGQTEGFAQPDNTVEIIDAEGMVLARHSGSKLSVANRILDLLPTINPLEPSR